jgi:DNA polymerase-4
VSRSESLPAATTDLPTVVGQARRLNRTARPPTAVRLIGVAYSGLDGEEQQALFGLDGPAPAAAPAPDHRPESSAPDPQAGRWRAGDDVRHPGHGHGWVQGCGQGRVTVRFETRRTGPGRAITFDAAEPLLTSADPLRSLDP